MSPVNTQLHYQRNRSKRLFFSLIIPISNNYVAVNKVKKSFHIRQFLQNIYFCSSPIITYGSNANPKPNFNLDQGGNFPRGQLSGHHYINHFTPKIRFNHQPFFKRKINSVWWLEMITKKTVFCGFFIGFINKL